LLVITSQFLLDYDKKIFLKLKISLQYFIVDVYTHSNLKNLSTIIELCQSLTKPNKLKIFYFIDCVIHFI